MKAPTVFTNIIAIFKPQFLNVFLKDKKTTGRSWGFWFLANLIIALVVACTVTVETSSLVQKANEDLYANYGDIQVQNKDGKFSTTLPQPFVLRDEQFVVVIETQQKQYSQEVLDQVDAGLYINADKAYFKTSHKTEMISFAEVGDFFLSEEQVYLWVKEHKASIFWMIYAAVAFGLFFFNSVVRLVFALWWALLIYIVSKIVKRPKLQFADSYLWVLNAYIPVIIIEQLLWQFNATFAFSTTGLFTLLAAWHFYSYKK